MINQAREQRPSVPENWLYRDVEIDDRWFANVVYLGINDTKWLECTQAEREIWESEHQPEEMEEESENI